MEQKRDIEKLAHELTYRRYLMSKGQVRDGFMPEPIRRDHLLRPIRPGIPKGGMTVAMKERHPAWFKMFWHQRALIDSLPDAKVGQALKAAYQYFEDGTVPKMTPLAFTLFSSIKPYVDESFADFEAISKKNRENIKRRWAKRGDTTDTSGIQSLS